MTAAINRQGQIVLRTDAGEKPRVKSGDVLLVVHHRAGRIVLQKQRNASSRNTQARKSYLTPHPLSARILADLYLQSAPNWDNAEPKAVKMSRRAKIGKPLENL